MGKIKYLTEEERKEAKKEYLKQYKEDNKEYLREQRKQYNIDNKEQKKQYNKQYNKTPMGRASNILTSYRQLDKKYNRGECTLTAKWMVENIFSKPCHYCGETDWTKIGCDRIDNSKPHTPDNVVPCCKNCNNKRQKKDYEEFIKEMGMA